MVTRVEATHQGAKFAEQWDEKERTVPEQAVKTFSEQLHQLDTLPSPEKNALKWANLRGATDGLIAKNVLPNLDVTDTKLQASNLRNCRVVGLTADGDKNAGNNDLVVAIGRKQNDASKAEQVVILGQDGKFYQAQKVEKGYVKTSELLANNAEELTSKFKKEGTTTGIVTKAKESITKQETPVASESPVVSKSATSDEKPSETKKADDQAGDKSDSENTIEDRLSRGEKLELSDFEEDLKAFQDSVPTSEHRAKVELDRLNETYCSLSADKQRMALHAVMEGNRQMIEDVWVAGVCDTRPRVGVSRDLEGAIRFSAEWSDGLGALFWGRTHQTQSLKMRAMNKTH